MKVQELIVKVQRIANEHNQGLDADNVSRVCAVLLDELSALAHRDPATFHLVLSRIACRTEKA